MASLSSLKPITLRLAQDDLSYIKQEAASLGISAGVYLRILVKQSLATKRQISAQQKANALRNMSDILRTEASVQDLSEAEILEMTKNARKEISQAAKVSKSF